MYIITNQGKIEKTFDSWWDLIKYINQYDDYEKGIAHNENDIYVYFNGFSTNIYSRPHIIYEDDRIINLSEIREGLKNYKERPVKKYYPRYFSFRIFEFRKEPVPGIGGHWSSWYRNNKTNKEYYAKLLPIAKRYGLKASRLKNNMNGSLDWDIHRHRDDNWKTSFKCKKQWQKHL